jgi:hypothetical protein
MSLVYQTRFGAFFAYSYVAGADEDDYERITPLTPEEARAWLEKKSRLRAGADRTAIWADAGSWLRRS